MENALSRGDALKKERDPLDFQERVAVMKDGRWPIQKEGGGYSNETIPWEVAEIAWKEYERQYPGGNQTMWRMGERGGFSPGELDRFYPGWREKVKDLDND